MVKPLSTNTGARERVTVYFSIEEGWIQYIYIDPKTNVEQRDIPCRTSIYPFSEAHMRQLRKQAESSPNIYIFQAKRDSL